MNGSPDTWITDHQAGLRSLVDSAQQLCGAKGCDGPTGGTLSFGPDGGGKNVVVACNEGCANCIRESLGGSAMIAVDPVRQQVSS